MRALFCPGNSPNVALALCAVLALAGCSLSPFDEDTIFRRTTTAAGVTGQLAEPAPFVRDSRPTETTYQPVGVTPTRSVDAQSPSGVQDMERALRERQATSVQQAARPLPPSPYDGKIEPGFKPPPAPPLPPDTAPKVELRGTQPAVPAAAAAAPTAQPRTQPATRTTAPRKKTQEGADTH